MVMRMSRHGHETGRQGSACPDSSRCRAGAEAVAIHLRLGDVVCGTKYHELDKRPFPPAAYEAIARRLPRGAPRYLFGQPYMSVKSSKICWNESVAYRAQVESALGATLFEEVDPDRTVCALTRAQIFVQGQGTFSETIRALRDLRGLRNIRITSWNMTYGRLPG